MMPEFPSAIDQKEYVVEYLQNPAMMNVHFESTFRRSSEPSGCFKTKEKLTTLGHGGACKEAWARDWGLKNFSALPPYLALQPIFQPSAK